jgi:transcriptional/translational regulatory protein YebC/TACO1
MTAALEAGAEDLEQQEEGYAVYTDPASLSDVREALEKAGYSIERAETEMVPKNTVQISDPEKARKVLRLMDLLEENDDTQNVYGNFDIPDVIMESLEG